MIKVLLRMSSVIFLLFTSEASNAEFCNILRKWLGQEVNVHFGALNVLRQSARLPVLHLAIM